MPIRNNSHRASTVSTTAATRQTSQTGKNDPSTSKEGALKQLVSTIDTSISPYLDKRLFPLPIMVEASWRLTESNLRFRKPDLPNG